jgi:hypothetical protein
MNAKETGRAMLAFAEWLDARISEKLDDAELMNAEVCFARGCGDEPSTDLRDDALQVAAELCELEAVQASFLHLFGIETPALTESSAA